MSTISRKKKIEYKTSVGCSHTGWACHCLYYYHLLVIYWEYVIRKKRVRIRRKCERKKNMRKKIAPLSTCSGVEIGWSAIESKPSHVNKAEKYVLCIRKKVYRSYERRVSPWFHFQVINFCQREKTHFLVSHFFANELKYVQSMWKKRKSFQTL